MRVSKMLLPTVRETPADAETISHKLMLRAGMIRKIAAGVYTWLPSGLRVLRKVEAVVRAEMNRAGAQEVLMPAVQPAELWQESGRWEQYGPELLRIKDRHQRDFCFGPTHEEVITDLARRELKSYRQLPANFYQIQMKFRDEIRPRFGVMRAREFLMKDAYSFHVDQRSLEETYKVMHETYCRIFQRVGLEFRPVAADTGSIGGAVSHEFHVLADSGEDAIAICNKCEYAANVELAQAVPPAAAAPSGKPMRTVDTPTQRTIDEVSKFLKIDAKQTVKTLIAKGVDGPIAFVLRGDHELNEIKAAKLPAVAKPFTFLTPEEVKQAVGCDIGSIGPVGLKVPAIIDSAAAHVADFVCGANVNGKHLADVNWNLDVNAANVADIRKVVDGDRCPTDNCGGTLSIRRGIEVGHIFQLGTKYSQALQATVLDEAGKAVVMPMGCYGIGVSRVVAAAIEQNHDDNGIAWPDAIAPFHVALVPIGYYKSAPVRETVDKLYAELTQAGIDVLLDDRDERPGVIFADMDLIGIPHRLVLGDKGLAKGVAEYKSRREKQAQEIPLADVVSKIRGFVKN